MGCAVGRASRAWRARGARTRHLVGRHDTVGGGTRGARQDGRRGGRAGLLLSEAGGGRRRQVGGSVNPVAPGEQL